MRLASYRCSTLAWDLPQGHRGQAFAEFEKVENSGIQEIQEKRNELAGIRVFLQFCMILFYTLAGVTRKLRLTAFL